MAMKSPEATIEFLLTAVDSVEGKVDWDAVAKKTGWYKSAKFSKQAFGTIQKKYAGAVIFASAGEDGGAPKAQNSKDKALMKHISNKQDTKVADEIQLPKKRGAVTAGGRRSKKLKIADGEGEEEDESSDTMENEEA